MLILAFLVSLLGVASGRWSNQPWARVSGGLLLLVCATFEVWAVLKLVDDLVVGLVGAVPAVAENRPVEATVAVVSLLPLLGLFGGRRWSEHRRRRRFRLNIEHTVTSLVGQINALAQAPGVADHDWLAQRWSEMSGTERAAWVSRRINSVTSLHREAGGLGLARLGRRAVDRLAQMDRLQR